jgi:hypothetical protein
LGHEESPPGVVEEDHLTHTRRTHITVLKSSRLKTNVFLIRTLDFSKGTGDTEQHIVGAVSKTSRLPKVYSRFSAGINKAWYV